MEVKTMKVIHSRYRKYILVNWRKFKKLKRKNDFYILDGINIKIKNDDEKNVTEITIKHNIQDIKKMFTVKTSIDYETFIIPAPTSFMENIKSSCKTMIVIDNEKYKKYMYPYFKNKGEFLKWKLKQ